MSKMWRNGLAVMVVLVLAACGNMVKVDAKSAKNLNVVGSGAPLPVVVRVYQLSDDAAFKSASFRDLWKKDAEILGPALLSSKEITLQPDSREKVSIPLDAKTKFIAGFALFRNPDAVKWNFVQPVSDGIIASSWHKLFPVSVSLRLSQSKIEIEN